MRAHTRDLPPRAIRFPHLQRRESPPSARVADQTVERDWRQVMPRAEPTLSLAPLRLSAVVGAATLRGRQSPPQSPSGYPQGKPGADLVLRHTHCHDTWHARPEGEERRGGRLPGRPRRGRRVIPDALA